jgi:hypothetical protein
MHGGVQIHIYGILSDIVQFFTLNLFASFLFLKSKDIAERQTTFRICAEMKSDIERIDFYSILLDFLGYAKKAYHLIVQIKREY